MGDLRFTDEQRSLIATDVATYVVACPGAGKTQTIVERFIRRANGVGGRSGIALVSFTNAAVDEARRRCVGTPGLLAAPNYVGTIDSFINRFMVSPVYSSLERRSLTFRDTWASVPGTRFTAKGIKGTFELGWFELSFVDGASLQLGRVPVAQRAFVGNLRASDLQTLNRKALAIWTQQLKRGVCDAATTRLFLSRYLEEPGVATQMQELLGARFAEVIVDEAQDCSKEDVLLLGLLQAAGVRLVLVGDPDQGIYGFRGGSSAELSTVTAHMEKGRRLNGNFRSSPAICALVDSLRSTGDRDEACGPHADVDVPVHVVPYARSGDVQAQVVAVLARCGVEARDVMILAHSGAKARACAGAGSLTKTSGSNRLVQLAQAVHALRDERAGQTVRLRALGQVERIVLELDLEGHDDLSMEEYLARRALTYRAFREGCLHLAVNLGDPFAGKPSEFKKRLIEAKSSQYRLGWSPSALRIPAKDAWGSIPKISEGLLPHSTVHGWKGLQAPAVALVMTEGANGEDGVADWLVGVASEARRVLYVGASRAQRLLILAVPAARVGAVCAMLVKDGVPFELSEAIG